MKSYLLRKLFILSATSLVLSCGTAKEISSSTSADEPCIWTDLPGPTAAPIITRSGVYSSAYEASNVLDNSDASLWISKVNETPAWLGYEYQGPAQRVLSYTLRFTNGSLTTRAPKNWTLQAWNGSSWIVIDTRNNEVNWKGVEERKYSVQQPGFYNKYKLNFTEDNDPRNQIVVISLGKVTFSADVGCSYDWSKLEGEWHRDNDLSTVAYDYFVPQSKPVPLVRFVAAMKFLPNNQYKKLMLAPNDAQYWDSGFWARSSDNRIQTSFQDPRLGTVNENLRVISVSKDVLKIAK